MKLTLTTALASALIATSAIATGASAASSSVGDETTQSPEIGQAEQLIEPGDGMESDVEDASRGEENEQSEDVAEEEPDSYTGGRTDSTETSSRGAANLSGEEVSTGERIGDG